MIKAKGHKEVLMNRHETRNMLTFLTHVAKSDPTAKTKVDAAKRAVNLLHSIADRPSLSENVSISLFTHAVRQTPVGFNNQTEPGGVSSIRRDHREELGHLR